MDRTIGSLSSIIYWLFFPVCLYFLSYSFLGTSQTKSSSIIAYEAGQTVNLNVNHQCDSNDDCTTLLFKVSEESKNI